MTNPLVSKYFEELITHQNRVMRELLQGKITPKEASAMDRAVGSQLRVIEEGLRIRRTLNRLRGLEEAGEGK
jgi:hypothetical protein